MTFHPRQSGKGSALALVAAGLFCLSGGAQAQVESDFQLQSIRELDTEYGLPFLRNVWIVGTNRIGFIPPRNWRVTGSPEKRRLLFQHEGMKASMTMTLLPGSSIPQPTAEPNEGSQDPNAALPGKAPTIKQWRLLVAESFPESKVETEWESIANGARATTFDMLQFPDGVRQNLRVAYIFHDGYAVELALRTGAKFADYIGDFMSILTSLDLNPKKAQPK